ncbi:MAG: hypothetical protein PHD13_02870 [Methanocellales archaeon]|nr:hypothetical protein [Methanocellales archaeon]MDD3291751.1 hypothetical protein [Methanocellales archaeon]MDD5235101.1 hypothetical protein [Methanocellales archaeon]MDD5485239.1 hypothetical protein [Methanocellales archaeon]
MDIHRSCKIKDLNWGSLPEIYSKFKKLNLDLDLHSAEINRFPDSITFNTLDDACENAKKYGSPKSYTLFFRGSELSSPALMIGRVNQNFLYVKLSDVDNVDLIDPITDFLGLEPDEPESLPPAAQRTVFIAHKFDKKGNEMSDKLAYFLGLLKFEVKTGRSYLPSSTSEKVLGRIKSQSVIILIKTVDDDDTCDDTWLTQESIISKLQGKPLIIIKDTNAKFKPGILSDHEYISFTYPNIEMSFIPLLEGLRELGYLSFKRT